MIGDMTSRVSATRRSWRRLTPVLGLGVVTLAATACGSGGGSTATPQATGSSPASANSRQAFPGVTGTAAAVSGSSLEVQNPTSGQVTVTFTAATTITDEVATTSKDVTVGSCVTVASQSAASGTANSGGAASRTVTATTVTISAPVKGSCSAGAGFGGFGGGQGGTPSARPSFSPGPRPTGSGAASGGGGFGGANGKVTSLSASGFVVQGRNPAASTDISITVTTTASTKYYKVVSAHPSALKVGLCITAVGTTNSIGAVAARTIRVSQPGPNGCVTSFGGGRGGFPGGPSSNAA